MASDDKTDFYFTFGQIHVHSVNGKTFDRNCVVRIRANDSGQARVIMVRNFGTEWAFEYEDKPDMTYFPRGIMPLDL